MHSFYRLAALWLTLLTACAPTWDSSDPRAHARAITEVPEGTVYYLNDHHNTPVVVLDERGNVIEERGQHAFGAERMLASVSEPWSFTGNELDATELGNFHARPYDARLGRFLAVDPEPLFNPGATTDPRSFLAYGYAAGDPVNEQDPAGRSIWTKLIKVGVKVWKTGNAVEAFADNVQDAVTLFDSTASVADRAWAGASLASELLPASVGDIKDAGRLLGVVGDARKAEKKTEVAKTLTSGRARGQERLRQIAADPNTSSADRGWIQQEINSMDRGTRTTIRNPPGKQLAHSRGREAAKGYDHVESPSNLQDVDLHRTQHKFDDFGRANKERP